ncbi:hypothetical protein B4134_0709 [Bacillus safensis]|nr:hypothetical protein B4134_0709 [Bacillus safensis]
MGEDWGKIGGSFGEVFIKWTDAKGAKNEHKQNTISTI